MTADRVRAIQTARLRPPGAVPSGQWVPCTIATASPLTVTLRGGGTVGALAIKGFTYTAGAAAVVFWQEPAVGPCLPLA